MQYIPFYCLFFGVKNNKIFGKLFCYNITNQYEEYGRHFEIEDNKIETTGVACEVYSYMPSFNDVSIKNNTIESLTSADSSYAFYWRILSPLTQEIKRMSVDNNTFISQYLSYNFLFLFN